MDSETRQAVERAAVALDRAYPAIAGRATALRQAGETVAYEHWSETAQAVYEALDELRAALKGTPKEAQRTTYRPLEVVMALDGILDVADIARHEDKYTLSLQDGNQVEVRAAGEDIQVDILVRVRGIKLQNVGGDIPALLSYVKVVLADFAGTYVLGR